MKKTVNQKNKKSKKHSRKYLPWIATLGILAIGVSVVTPLTFIYSCSGNKPAPDPKPVVDPTDPNAYLMIEGTDFLSPQTSDPFIKTFTIPSTEKSIKFEGLFTKGQSAYFFMGGDFSNLEYVQFGKGFGSTASDTREEGFDFFSYNFKDKNIEMIVFNDMRSKIDLSHTTSISILDNFNAPGALDGNHKFFFDLDIDLVRTEDKTSGLVLAPFTTNPEEIYIRESNKGSIKEWTKKLGITDESIFKIVK